MSTFVRLTRVWGGVYTEQVKHETVFVNPARVAYVTVPTGAPGAKATVVFSEELSLSVTEEPSEVAYRLGIGDTVGQRMLGRQFEGDPVLGSLR